jgi:hypothetical protein
MFKGFSEKNNFKGIPEKIFGNQTIIPAYGIDGCFLWLDPQDIQGISNLDRLSNWVAKQKNWNFIQQSTSNQPRWIESTPSFNNHPSVDFDTNVRNFILPTGGIIPFGFNWSIAFVSQTGALSGNTGQRSIFDDGIETSINLVSAGDNRPDFDGIGIYNRGFNSARTATILGSGIKDSAAHITVIRAGISTARLIVDGVETVTGTWVPAGKWVRLGANNATNLGSMLLAEVLIFSRYLSNSEMDTLSTELNAKYAIY